MKRYYDGSNKEISIEKMVEIEPDKLALCYYVAGVASINIYLIF